jgi:hypothetical protein
MGLQVNPGGQTVYDPMTQVTWLADANLAANVKLGLPPCQTPTTPTNCIAQDGTMNYASAGLFISNMNAYDNGAGYLGQTTWMLPKVDPACPIYGCAGMRNPMGICFITSFTSPRAILWSRRRTFQLVRSIMSSPPNIGPAR